MNTTIRISKELRESLKSIGRKSETYDYIIRDILNHSKGCDRFWSERQ